MAAGRGLGYVPHVALGRMQRHCKRARHRAGIRLPPSSNWPRDRRWDAGIDRETGSCGTIVGGLGRGSAFRPSRLTRRRRVMRRFPVVARAGLSIIALFAAVVLSVTAQEVKDKGLADLAGQWQITYTNGAVRLYSIDNQGVATFEQENVKGRVFRKSEALLLSFAGDAKIERLTLGTDGRLFVEHFQQQADVVGKFPEIMGIGIQQK